MRTHIEKLDQDRLPPVLARREAGQRRETVEALPASLREAADLLRKGQLVAFPTETVYGLGADGLQAEAVASIFRTKGRPADNPLILHIADRSQVEDVAEEVSDFASLLMEKFWPGPLTLVMKRRNVVPDVVTAGLDTVGLRLPSHPVAHALLLAVGRPIAAPSANLSGKPSPTTAADCFEDLQGKVPLILDGGACEIGLESTVLDVSGEEPRVLRPGRVTEEEIRSLWQIYLQEKGETETDVHAIQEHQLAEGETPQAPGMKYRHYAPQAEVVLVDLPPAKEAGMGLPAALFDAVEALRARPGGEHLRLAYYGSAEGLGAGSAQLMDHFTDGLVYGSFADVDAAARGLFAALRELDRREVDVILTHALPEEGEGRAYMNRLRKAAGKQGLTPGK